MDAKKMYPKSFHPIAHNKLSDGYTDCIPSLTRGKCQIMYLFEHLRDCQVHNRALLDAPTAKGPSEYAVLQPMTDEMWDNLQAVGNIIDGNWWGWEFNSAVEEFVRRLRFGTISDAHCRSRPP